MIINQIILNSKINYFNMKKILILGSRGQIGSHLLNFLKNKNYKTYEFDLINNKSEDLRINSNHKFLSYIKKADFVFFLAFDVGGSVYLKKYQNSYNFLMNNILIMKNTFQVLYKEKKNWRRYYQIIRWYIGSILECLWRRRRYGKITCNYRFYN